MMTSPRDIAQVFIEQSSKKPIIPIIMGGSTAQSGREVLMEHGKVNFDLPTDAVEALDALARGLGKPSTRSGPRLTNSLKMMELGEMERILATFQLGLEGEFVQDKGNVEYALEELGGGPYAMKAISTELVHKSDLKAVELNLQNAEEITQAWNGIEDRVRKNTHGGTIDGMLIQKMVKGVECIVGMKRDATFGPTIVFGLGGVFVEILKDSSMRVAPVTEVEAFEQIGEIKGLPLLTGARGTDPVDLSSIARLIANLSELSLEHTEIEEIDFNPVFVTKEGAHIVDARFMVK
jgi:acetyltransferase